MAPIPGDRAKVMTAPTTKEGDELDH